MVVFRARSNGGCLHQKGQYRGRLELLIDDNGNLVGGGVLNNGQANALSVKLHGVIEKLTVPKTCVTFIRLAAIIHQVESLVDDVLLRADQGRCIVHAANSILERIIALS